MLYVEIFLFIYLLFHFLFYSFFFFFFPNPFFLGNKRTHEVGDETSFHGTRRQGQTIRFPYPCSVACQPPTRKSYHRWVRSDAIRWRRVSYFILLKK